MRYFICFLLVSLFSCDFFYEIHLMTDQFKKDDRPFVKPSNKPIKEIIFYIRYKPKPTEEIKKNLMKRYQTCMKTYSHKPEICKDRHPDKYRINFKIKYYCYEVEKIKTSVFNKNLKVRLYDKEGNILDEDYLRCDIGLDGTEICHKTTISPLMFSLPYFKKADKVKIIEIEEEKETILNEYQLLSNEELKNSKTFYKGSTCHGVQIAPYL